MTPDSNMLLALVEGFALAFSPCILPVLPLILASATGQNRLRPFLIIIGFIVTFTVFTLVARQLLAASGIEQDMIQRGAYALLLVFGLVLLVPFLEQKFSALTAQFANKAQDLSSAPSAQSAWGGLVVGALIGLVWTPCAGPILAAALVQVIQAETSAAAVMTVAAFSIGVGVPMLIIALFGQYLTGTVRAFAGFATLFKRAMGALIVLFAGLSLMGVNVVAALASQKPGEGPLIPSTSLIHGLEQPYAAPAIQGVQQWFNTQPLDLAKLRGKVVLIDFWTYSCINCIRTFPHIKAWHERYKDKGLVIIGMHAPEFAFEAKPENVAQAIKKFGIAYPVAMDNDFATWKNYQNKYWPAHYLIDRDGKVVYTHYGEGSYDVTENNIRYLLGAGKAHAANAANAPYSDRQTEETYLGTERGKRLWTSAEDMPLHHWQLTGVWKRAAEYSEAGAVGDILTLRFRAKKVFVVMESVDGQPKPVRVRINGKPTLDGPDMAGSIVTVDKARLYEVYNGAALDEALVSLTADQPGVRFYAFTFES